MTAALRPGRPSGLTVVHAAVTDPLVLPMLRELGHEYAARYGRAADREMDRYPAAEFAPPCGVLLLLLADGDPVAGGAFRRYAAAAAATSTAAAAAANAAAATTPTAELKRIWTHSAHRRRGLARRVLVELEREARARGYHRLYLTTGPRQPEARQLYLSTGYTPLFDTSADPESIGPLPFEKHLAAATGRREA